MHNPMTIAFKREIVDPYNRFQPVVETYAASLPGQPIHTQMICWVQLRCNAYWSNNGIIPISPASTSWTQNLSPPPRQTHRMVPEEVAMGGPLGTPLEEVGSRVGRQMSHICTIKTSKKSSKF
jgi:hypothetical protein